MLVNKLCINVLYFYAFLLIIAFATLLGGFTGLFLKNIISMTKGIVIIIAYHNNSCFTSSTVLWSFFIMNPGNAAPIVIEHKLRPIPTKATKLTD